jgi:hypothetical protein
MSANSELRDRAVSHQVYLLRYSGHVRNKVVAHLNRVEDDLLTQIRKRADAGTFTEWRLNKILDDVRSILDEARPETMGIVRDDMLALGGYEADHQARAIQSSVPVELNITKPTSEQIRAGVMSRPFQGKLLREWVDELDGATRRRIRDAVRIGWTEGETIDAMVRRIRGTRAAGYKDGVMEITRRGAQAMVRTAVSHTSNYSRQLLWEENQDIVKGVQWVSTLDNRTCFVAGTTVETPAGAVAIEKIERGDVVVGGSGEPRQVLATKATKKTRMARVSLSNGETVVCTADHLFRTAAGKWKEAEQLSAGESLARRL